MTQALSDFVGTLSVGTAAILVTIKIVAWIASGSVAMLASMADSGLDLVASLATFFAVRYAAAPPDAEHRFGHGKAEAFASLLQGGLVLRRSRRRRRALVRGTVCQRTGLDAAGAGDWPGSGTPRSVRSTNLSMW